MTALKLEQQIIPLAAMPTIEQHSENGANQALSLSLINPQVTTLATIVDEEYPLSIIRARQEQGEELLYKYIMDKINDYLDAVDLRNTMNPKQVLLASTLIVEKHPHLPVKSLDVFFKNAICGEYGPHYNRMDIPTLMGWLNQFESEYFEEVEEKAYQEHVSTKGDNANFMAILAEHKALAMHEEDEPIPMPDDFLKNMKENRKRKEITERVHKENAHLYSTMSVAEADKVIEMLIQDELIQNNIF